LTSARVPGPIQRLTIALLSFFLVASVGFAYRAQVTEPSRANDFPTWYFSARAVALGWNPYDVRGLNVLAGELGLGQRVLPYLYPPPLAQAFAPMAAFPYGVSRTIWLLLNAAVCASMLALAGRLARADGSGDATALALLIATCGVLYPIANDLKNGQVNILMTWLVVVALTSRRSWISGVALAWGTAVKIVPIVFLGWPLAKRRWQVVKVTGAAGLLILGMSVAAGGLHLWRRFFAFLSAVRHGNAVPGTVPPQYAFNIGLSGSLTRLLGPGDPLIPVLVMMAIILILLPLVLRIRRLEASQAILGLTLAALLSSPFGWIHHHVFLFPALVLAAAAPAGRLIRRKTTRADVIRISLILTSGLPYANLGLGGRLGFLASASNLLLASALYVMVLVSGDQASWSGPGNPKQRSSAD
jgi:hypothetical protein